ncbi:glycosyltransferase [Solirubrobacter ginsenosidimutans]|uniref:Glycosyltransferase n=1 Tax=Solirubrobacter ginsenosidimutans TaxID=490573 RepID=A0A9X3N8T1_9ACTN|nr:glycosyltransferase [Solirubrobacter ginsenosidimutans]MDA0166943.1 glycosyltransferase [Solirubrobacter ginsenosidimutans]
MKRRLRPSPSPSTTRSVSVIVPSYNYGHVVSGCVASVLSQEGVDVRVLVIDDCSSDQTVVVGERLAQDDRVEFRRHAVNQGLHATANEGLAWADGDYVVLLSADDFLAPGALHRAVSVMEEHPNVGMVYGRAPYFSEDSAPSPDVGVWRGTDVWKGRDWIELRCRSAHNCISSPEVVVRTSVHREIGVYDPVCHHASDLHMWLRVAAVSDIAYVRGIDQARYRVHADSMLRSDAGPMIDLQQRRLAFDRFFEIAGDHVPDAAELHTFARRALARQALWRASRAYDRGLVSGSGAFPVRELIDFALDVYPGARELREWQGLRARRRLGEGRSRWFPLFVATGAGHRLRGHYERIRRERAGV